jgi:hypothetical protein
MQSRTPAGIALCLAALAFVFSFESCVAGMTAESGVPAKERSVDSQQSDETVAYPRSFFDTYSPVNALDMVRQIPGFRLAEAEVAVASEATPVTCSSTVSGRAASRIGFHRSCRVFRPIGSRQSRWCAATPAR